MKNERKIICETTKRKNFSPTHYTPLPQHTLVTEIRELIYPEDRPRFDEIVYRRYTTGNKTTSTTAVPTTSTSSRIEHYDPRHVSGKFFSVTNFLLFPFHNPQFFTAPAPSFLFSNLSNYFYIPIQSTSIALVTIILAFVCFMECIQNEKNSISLTKSLLFIWLDSDNRISSRCSMNELVVGSLPFD